jgi:hypothetical protein
MIIYKNSTRPITDNFNENELYSKSLDAPDSHYLDDNVIYALQTIRSFFNSPIRVTSTFRTSLGNSIAGGVSQSQHLISNAIDFQFINNNTDKIQSLQSEWNKKGTLYKTLRSHGINGIGFYTNFIHIDTRPNEKFITVDSNSNTYSKHLNTNPNDEFGTYQTWGTSLNQGFISNLFEYSHEDGYISIEKYKKLGFFFILILIFLYTSSLKKSNKYANG